MTTTEATKFMLMFSLESSVKAAATVAMIIAIEGRIIPAIIADSVPTTKSSLSVTVMYRKKVKNPMLSGACFGTSRSIS